MRLVCVLGIALCMATAAGVVGSAGVPAADEPAADAATILAAAREALGGEKKLSAVTSFIAKGRSRQVRGNNLVPIEFEILCQLPDKYLRKDEIPAQESEPTTSGFNGEALIQIPVPPPMAAAPAAPKPPAAAPGTATSAPATGAPAPPAGAAPAGASPAMTAAMAAAMAGRAGGPMPGGPPGDPRKARVANLKQDFARLTLGMFAASFSGYPLTFTHVGQAEAPQGKADVIEVKGVGTFTLRLFINSQTHLPIMVSWTVPATNAVVTIPGQPKPENLSPGSIIVEAPAPPLAPTTKEALDQYQKDVQDLRRKALAGKLIEHRLYYADYRDIGSGLKFPFRLRRAIATDTTEEINFDGFEVNRRIDPRRFEPVK